MPSWSLDNAAEIAAQHPYTFYKPSAETLAKLRLGQLVKLIFRFDSDDPKAPRAERMWVKLESIDGLGSYTGQLDNNPRYIKDIACGDLVIFQDIHIINTEHDEPDNLVEKYLPRCFVTNRILKDGKRVGYLYREEPEYENDSGWRIIAGDESDQYMDDSNNIAYVSLGAVLNQDDSILGLLDCPTGSAFGRFEDEEEFSPVERASNSQF